MSELNSSSNGPYYEAHGVGQEVPPDPLEGYNADVVFIPNEGGYDYDQVTCLSDVDAATDIYPPEIADDFEEPPLTLEDAVAHADSMIATLLSLGSEVCDVV